MGHKRISLYILEYFCREALVCACVPPTDAAIVADVLVASDRLGVDSHGINRLKSICLDQIREGILNPVTDSSVVRESPTPAVLNGNNGVGHVVGRRAMEMYIRKAQHFGMGMVAVRNSSHYGIAGYYNPLTFAMPSDEPFFFCLNGATSVSQRAKFEYYAENGKDTPQG